MGTFDSTLDTNLYVEIEDETYVDPDPDPILGPRKRMVRPPAGTKLLVRSSIDQSVLAPQVTLVYGRLSFEIDSQDYIDISADNGTSWYPHASYEAQQASLTSGANSLAALNTAVAAQQTAMQALGGRELIIYQIDPNLGGGYARRTTVTSDPTVSVKYIELYDASDEPDLGTDPATAYATDLTADPIIPGDFLQLRVPQ